MCSQQTRIHTCQACLIVTPFGVNGQLSGMLVPPPFAVMPRYSQHMFILMGHHAVCKKSHPHAVPARAAKGPAGCRIAAQAQGSAQSFQLQDTNNWQTVASRSRCVSSNLAQSMHEAHAAANSLQRLLCADAWQAVARCEHGQPWPASTAGLLHTVTAAISHMFDAWYSFQLLSSCHSNITTALCTARQGTDAMIS